MKFRFDIVVIGGGHAGYEAAHIAAKMGKSVCLITQNADAIGRLSCNPAMGGIAKGQLIKETDALGGLIGRITDATCLQFKMLNKSKGPAVWSPRAQCDKIQYEKVVQGLLSNTQNLWIVQAEAKQLIIQNKRVSGVRTTTGDIKCGKVILSAGTFLNGVTHTGTEKKNEGRKGEGPSIGLSESLVSEGFQTSRLKTGTPPRILIESICFKKLRPDFGDQTSVPFSFFTNWFRPLRVPCFFTNTNEKVHDFYRANLEVSPLYNGQIESVGPRYCPSIEDKIVRFSERESHQVVLEPESLHDPLCYMNGFSTSMPEEIQKRAIRSIVGLEEAEIVRYGYAVEYDFFDPRQLMHTLETKEISGLYLAGQVNGTTGYEEAASQGILAGINAALSISGEDPLIIKRQDAYLGVLVDDLVTKGTEEPYRMFTSRAEYRLRLRQDNSVDRLFPHVERTSVFNEKEKAHIRKYLEEKEIVRGEFGKRRLTESEFEIVQRETEIPRDHSKYVRDLLQRNDITMSNFDDLDFSKEAFYQIGHNGVHSIETDLKYKGYLEKQDKLIKEWNRFQEIKIPSNTDFNQISNISMESRQKLNNLRPQNLEQASRISGITPADLTVLSIHFQKFHVKQNRQGE